MVNPTLEQKLEYIGIRINSPALFGTNSMWIDIESTIIDCLESNDGRLIGLIFSWLRIHKDRVVVEKLLKYQRERPSIALSALGVYAFSLGSHRFKKLIFPPKKPTYLFDNKANRALGDLKGLEPIYKEHKILIPTDSIRVRDKDVMSPEILVKSNKQYKNRLLYGANWRADIITAIQMNLGTPYRISKIIDCSQPSVNKVFREYTLAVS